MVSDPSRKEAKAMEITICAVFVRMSPTARKLPGGVARTASAWNRSRRDMS